MAFVALSAAAPNARAQSDEQRADARSLAVQGVKAFSEGRWQDAVDFLDRAESLVHAPTHLLFLARAHAKLRHYVKARELYLRIAHQTIGASASQAFRDAQASAADEVADVEPHIGQLTISVRGPDPNTAKVTMDGAAVQSVLIGVARPVDPGEHQVNVEASGFAAQSKKVTVGDGGSATVVLELAPGGSSATAPGSPSSASTGSAGALSSPPPALDTRSSSRSGKRIGAYVALGVGAVGLGAGTFFVVRSASKRADADKKFEECGGATGCRKDDPLSAEVSSLDRAAGSAKTLGIIGFAVGGAAVATGVTLFVLSGGRKKTTADVSVSPWVGLGNAGLRGTF